MRLDAQCSIFDRPDIFDCGVWAAGRSPRSSCNIARFPGRPGRPIPLPNRRCPVGQKSRINLLQEQKKGPGAALRPGRLAFVSSGTKRSRRRGRQASKHWHGAKPFTGCLRRRMLHGLARPEYREQTAQKLIPGLCACCCLLKNGHLPLASGEKDQKESPDRVRPGAPSATTSDPLQAAYTRRSTHSSARE